MDSDFHSNLSSRRVDQANEEKYKVVNHGRINNAFFLSISFMNYKYISKGLCYPYFITQQSILIRESRTIIVLIITTSVQKILILIGHRHTVFY